MSNYITGIVLVALLTLLSNCNDDADSTTDMNQVIKYEITGTYTGKLVIVYNDNINGNTVLNDVSLPWSLEITRAKNVIAIGIAAQSSSTLGINGQVVDMKILVKGNVVKSSSAIAGSLGELVLPGLAYSF